MPRFLTLAPIALSCLLAGPPANAEEPAPPARFFEQVEVNVVNVEVYVTDKEGRPVTGLGREDFELLEDGEPVDIRYFFAAENGREPQTPADPAGEERREVAPETGAGAAVEPPHDDSQRLTVVVFIDDANLFPQSRDRVLELLRTSRWLEPAPGDRAMIVSHREGGSIEVVEPLTDDRARLLAALDRVAETPPTGIHVMRDLMGIVRDMVEIGQAAEPLTFGSTLQENQIDPDVVYHQVSGFAEREHAKTRRTLAALEGFVDSLAGLPGRKALVYVSDGLELRSGESLFEAFTNQFGGDPDSAGRTAVTLDATPDYRRLVEHANASRVTFYPLLAGGGDTRHVSLAESQRHGGRVWMDRVESLRRSNLRAPMTLIAEGTGGLALVEPKRFEREIARLEEDFGTYYSLGYDRPSTGDVKLHRLRVKVKDPALRVRHRESFREKTSEELMAARTLSALYFDGGENPLAIAVEFGEPAPGAKGQLLVPVEVKVPIAKLLLMPRDHYHQGSLSIFVTARDALGRVAPVQKMPVPVRIPNDKVLTALSQVAAFRMTLEMRDGEHQVAVGVRDELAQVESTLRSTHSP